MTDKKTIYAAYKSGNTYLEIAEKYDLTRGKVAGIISRYRKALKSNSCKGEKIMTMQEPANDIPLPPPIEVNTVDEWLHSGRCRYIGEKDGQRTFCGHVRKRGKSWCEEHYDLCVRKKK